jgi:predicted HicB family RNase H-like nuclease
MTTHFDEQDLQALRDLLRARPMMEPGKSPQAVPASEAGPMVQLNVRIPSTAKAQLARYAERSGVSLAAVIVRAIAALTTADGRP